VGFGSLTTFDPSRVPEGRATLHAWDYVPYDRPDGKSWDATKHEYAQRMLEHMGGFIENIGARIILQYPLRQPGRHGAHLVELQAWRSARYRDDELPVRRTPATPELGQFTVPGVERLYLVGPFQHPGGGVFRRWPGAAMKFMEDTKATCRA
jgi:phytoene dehydrogenase-like protein